MQSRTIPEFLQPFMEHRICLSCESDFQPTDVAQKYCTRKCSEREIQRRQREKQRKNRAQLAIMNYGRMTGTVGKVATVPQPAVLVYIKDGLGLFCERCPTSFHIFASRDLLLDHAAKHGAVLYRVTFPSLEMIGSG